MNKALKIKDGKFINMDHIVRWEVSAERILLQLTSGEISISDEKGFTKQSVERIHNDICQYMGAQIDSLVDQYNQENNDTNEDVNLSVSQMNASWKPNQEVNDFLLINNIPQPFAQSQLLKFKQYYIENGKSAMFWDARFINWLQQALKKLG